MNPVPDEVFFPCTMWRAIGNGIFWRPYKHWAQGYKAAEGLEVDHGDHSGCLKMVNGIRMTDAPLVVSARIYRKEGCREDISAVFSYPNGLSIHPDYFWEIYGGNDIVRFFGPDAEQKMEAAIVGVFALFGQEALPGEASLLLEAPE